MRRHSVLFILLIALWFIGTNHCTFQICAPRAASDSTTSIPFQPAQQHEHGGAGSHPCGTPCNVGAVLGSSQDSFAKVVVLPDQIIGPALLFLINSADTFEPLVVSTSSEGSFSPHCLTLISALKDAPNAPPVLHA